MKRAWNVLHNRIWILAAVMLALFFSLQNSSSLFLPALALEQQARCGIVEHVHTEDCYLDDILICREKAHTHSENCYLVLLEDNDINTLLTQVDESADKNLETMIAQVVNDAILYQDGGTADTGQEAAPAELWAAYTSSPSASPSVSPDGWTFFTSGTATPAPTESQVPAPMSVYAATLDGDVRSADISQLNANISDGGIEPGVVLNESLTTMALTPQDTQPVSTLGLNSGVSTLAVSGTPSYATRAINFYIRLDGNITFINSGTLTNSSPDYYSYSNTVSAYTDVVITGLSTSNINQTYYFRYNTNGNTTSTTNFNTSASYNTSNSRVTFGYNSNARYAILSSTRNSTTPVDFYTVTLRDPDGKTLQTLYVESGKTITLPDEYDEWVNETTGTTLNGGGTPAITGKTTFTAVSNVPVYYTVTYLNTDGTQLDKATLIKGSTIPLPPTPEANMLWKDLQTASYYPAGNATLTATRDHTFQAVSAYTVTLLDPGGNALGTSLVPPGGTYTLPTLDTGSVWQDANGNNYGGGQAVEINENTVFTQKPILTIHYDVDFNTASAGGVGITNASSPTVMGASTNTHTLAQGSIETIYSVSETLVTTPMPIQNSDARPGIAVFQGWKVGSTKTLLQPGESYSYSDLLQYAGSSGTVTLTGSWEYTKELSVNFFVEFDSAGDSTAATDFTKVLYNTYYGGTAPKNITSGTDQEKNEAIRALASNGTDAAYLASFPTDEYIFEVLESYTSVLEVDDIPVRAEDLNEHGYTILWTKLSYISADGNYHLDGILVRKVGYLDITKTFAGNKDAISTVKDGNYSILAESEDGTQVTLTLNNYDSYDSATDTYTWRIEDVAYGEKWTITEANYGSPYAEYTVTDVLGTQSKTGEYTGSGITVTGQTYDSTISADEVLSVGLTNIYPGTDSFILKKEDTETTQALLGAEFQLLQNGDLLSFSYDSTNGIYTCDPHGAITALSGSSGFLEITVSGLDFTQGDILVRESTVPEGYISSGDVVLTKDSSGIGIADSSANTTAYMKNGVLVIGNSPTATFVTVEKHWNDPNDATSVKLQLLANGELVSKLFPSVPAEVTLAETTDGSTASYTWNSLPAYANGSLIAWSVNEIQIGEERSNSDGTFPNWILDYAPATQITNSDGETGTLLVVTNARKAGNLLTLYKTDASGSRLTGAVFNLQMLTGDGSISSDFTAQVGTSDSSGYIAFHGLPYGRYLLTETSAPAGYLASGPIQFTINSDHTITITQDSGGTASLPTSSSLAIRVINRSAQPLPETGGRGPFGFYAAGGALMLLSLCAAILPKLRKRGRYQMRD